MATETEMSGDDIGFLVCMAYVAWCGLCYGGLIFYVLRPHMKPKPSLPSTDPGPTVYKRRLPNKLETALAAEAKQCLACARYHAWGNNAGFCHKHVREKGWDDTCEQWKGLNENE